MLGKQAIYFRQQRFDGLSDHGTRSCVRFLDRTCHPVLGCRLLSRKPPSRGWRVHDGLNGDNHDANRQLGSLDLCNGLTNTYDYSPGATRTLTAAQWTQSGNLGVCLVRQRKPESRMRPTAPHLKLEKKILGAFMQSRQAIDILLQT